jgi:hypothetical protein
MEENKKKSMYYHYKHSWFKIFQAWFKKLDIDKLNLNEDGNDQGIFSDPELVLWTKRYIKDEIEKINAITPDSSDEETRIAIARIWAIIFICDEVTNAEESFNKFEEQFLNSDDIEEDSDNKTDNK